MPIFLNILFLIIGMALLIKGADFFVSGASEIARRLKVPAMFIGLTIVALGTSLPELSVSITSAISGSIDMSVGNIVGSNLFNMLLILGLIAMFKPVVMEDSTKKIDLPFLIAVTGILMLFGFDRFLNGETENMLSRTESIILIILLILYLYILITNANRKRKRQLKQEKYIAEMQKNEVDDFVVFGKDITNESNLAATPEKTLKVWQIILYVVLGLAAVVFGGECVSSTAQYLALAMGMSEALVGLTIVAVGTSLPELVTSVVAAKKGENDLALGNVIGSSIMNISLILGSVGLIAQAPISMAIVTDIVILFVSTIIFSVMCIKGKNITKLEGAILFGMYISYLAFAIVRNYCF